jgi:hypothetical protein
MTFGLLLPHLPHTQEARVHYDSMLSLHVRTPHKLAALWRRLVTPAS